MSHVDYLLVEINPVFNKKLKTGSKANYMKAHGT